MLQPALRLLKPVTNPPLPGQSLLTYVTEKLPRVRPQLDEIVATWPDSPLALAKLLADFSPIPSPLERVDKMSKTSPLFAIATSEELSALRVLNRRATKLGELLVDAQRSLEAMGWMATEDGKLKPHSEGRGRRARHQSLLFRGLYYYLWPIYRRTFGDTARNPDPLREHISGLLSPYFELTEISPHRKGRIGSVIDKFVYGDERAAALLAEPYAGPLTPFPPRGPSLLPQAGPRPPSTQGATGPPGSLRDPAPAWRCAARSPCGWRTRPPPLCPGCP